MKALRWGNLENAKLQRYVAKAIKGQLRQARSSYSSGRSWETVGEETRATFSKIRWFCFGGFAPRCIVLGPLLGAFGGSLHID